ncbi:MAG: TetR/AcrR family transcriptional regulator [Lachnospiraceae bacterium]|nr:TetR/AcrR family transcriptional regulator [Lachnospiraceae bacterium]
MAKTSKEQSDAMRRRILNAAAESFLENGFTDTTVRSITTKLGISIGAFNSHFRTKEDVLCELIGFVLESQFSTSEKLLAGKTEDKLLLYAAETALQLHIVELNENLRDVYSSAYSLPKTSALIQQTVTGKLERIFREYLPELQTKDFYILEIATGGIMRGFMTVPCNMWFTMDQKVEAFLKNAFRLYDIPPEKIQEAVDFVKQFDFQAVAKETLSGIFRYLEESSKQQGSFS